MNQVVSIVNPGNPAGGTAQCDLLEPTLATLAYNKAYGKFVDKVKDPANWAVNLAEYEQSLDAMVKRTKQLTDFCRALHRFDFLTAAHELGLFSTPKGLKKKGKAFANNFLEFHFGWEPLVKDIGATIDLFQQPMPKRMEAKGTGSAKFNHLKERVDLSSQWSDREKNFVSYSKLTATFSVESPNLFLANQMGFVNPYVVAWELVPFSFVVDWFTNVGQILGSYTEFVGLSMSSPSNTTYQVLDKSVRNSRKSDGLLLSGGDYKSVYCIRANNLGAGPEIALKPFKGFSLVRGTTAISLLLQQLR